jgi:hypothetical protein
MMVGLIVLLAAGLALARHLPAASGRGGRESERSLAIVILIGFGLLFIADMAIGRVSLGLQAIQNSRYVTLEMTCLVGLYLAALDLRGPWGRNLAVGGVLVAALHGGLLTKKVDEQGMNRYFTAKKTWVATFLATDSIPEADRAAGIPLYPNPQATRLRAKLRFLRENGLSFYHDVPGGTTRPGDEPR